MLRWRSKQIRAADATRSQHALRCRRLEGGLDQLSDLSIDAGRNSTTAAGFLLRPGTLSVAGSPSAPLASGYTADRKPCGSLWQKSRYQRSASLLADHYAGLDAHRAGLDSFRPSEWPNTRRQVGRAAGAMINGGAPRPRIKRHGCLIHACCRTSSYCRRCGLGHCCFRLLIVQLQMFISGADQPVGVGGKQRPGARTLAGLVNYTGRYSALIGHHQATR